MITNIIYIGIGFMICSVLWLLYEIKNAPLIDGDEQIIEDSDEDSTNRVRNGVSS